MKGFPAAPSLLQDAQVPHAFAGVYSSPTCLYKPEDLDHAVLAVGYGTTADGQHYWLVRNSWSRYWGNQVHSLQCLRIPA